MPDKREWLLHESINKELLNEIKSDFTLYGASHLNLMNSSKALLTALTSSNVANEVIRRRNQGDLTRQSMSQITGILQDEDIIFSPTNTLQATITATYGEAQIQTAFIVEVSPYATGNIPPFNIIQTTGG
jgi:hypothetical protein